jgi:hypothetical protein
MIFYLTFIQMKKIFILGLLIATTLFASGQRLDYIINAEEVERIEKVLASDEMRGRRVFTPEIEKALILLRRNLNPSDCERSTPMISTGSRLRWSVQSLSVYPGP